MHFLVQCATQCAYAIPSNMDDAPSYSCPCGRPDGAEGLMIGCDAGCGLWYHLRCVGLARTQVPVGDFHCPGCVQYAATMMPKKPPVS